MPGGPIDRRGFLTRLGVAAAMVGGGPRLALARSPAETIWQRIWDADQAERGIPAILADQRGDPEIGFVRVDERADARPQHRLFSEVVIPERKRLTYDLCRALFDNYRLDQSAREQTTPEEAQELLALLDAITDSAPMQLACAHVEDQLGRPCSREAWQEALYTIWLRPFDMGRNRDLTGFEHVVVGEQKGGEVSGYHFWYKYYLDDLGVLSGEDGIDWMGNRYGRSQALRRQGRDVAEVVTLAHRWDARDPETGAGRTLEQAIGGFWVGCSVEGLMALGTVRFFAPGPAEAVINGARYQIDLYRSPDGQSLRTTFPRFLGLV
ncbi:MAG: twin-arginine translocation signal domain-containing protein [Pseudomonadota bacterium]